MANFTHAEASANILRFVDEGRLAQYQWHGMRKDGQEIACLLGSIHPRVTTAAECNGALMPLWLAELTPTLFDGIPTEEIYTFARRYGSLVARWHAFDRAAWDHVLTKFLLKLIDDAVESVRPVAAGKDYWPIVEAACSRVKKAIENGDEADAGAAAAAATEAARAARAEATEAIEATRAAKATAWAAEATRAARAAAWAAEAAKATAWAAEAAKATAKAARAAAEAAKAAAWATEATAAIWAAAAAKATAKAAAGATAKAAAGAAIAAAIAAAKATYLRLANFLLDQIEVALGSAA